ncbi:FadR/GntR family transcriptional regulator [Capillimicrobium parvum]|nr:FCD domain-containing protein [Capillimicrobium parvum]
MVKAEQQAPEAGVPYDDRGTAAFRPIRVRTAADEVVAVLVNAISGGLYPPGSMLPRERDLAARLGVSRTVVHEAIGVLRRAGVVSVRRGASGGATVIAPEKIAEVMAGRGDETALALPTLLEVRRTLELTGALLAAERATAAELSHLRELVEALDELLDDAAAFLARDIRFHAALATASGSPGLAQSVRWVLDRITLVMTQCPVGRVDLGVALANQRRTLEAVERRDPERIIATMDDHMAAFEELFVGRRLGASRPAKEPSAATGADLAGSA